MNIQRDQLPPKCTDVDYAPPLPTPLLLTSTSNTHTHARTLSLHAVELVQHFTGVP